ncbi:uncharacterized protein YbjT (DUF2867 family) [Bradyrhizobium sp. USDA 4508]
MTILVTGSTGTIGTQVLNHLAGQGVEVRALTRSPGKAQFPQHVTAVRGDLADVDSVRAALVGVSTLFLLVPNAADELTQAMLTLTAARARPASRASSISRCSRARPMRTCRISPASTRSSG